MAITTGIRHASAADMEKVRDICRQYRSLLLERTGDRAAAVEAYYPADAFEDFIATLETVHARPTGAILVATLNGDVVGCGMLSTHSTGLAEMYRLFVEERARGHSLGRRLCEQLIDDARAMGHTKIRLETGKPLVEAISLYTSMGFSEIPVWYKVPSGLDGILMAFERPI
ncbi:MAG: GNAT family N-acetyltransferase [Boseongicola sp.]|nr:GNAT family N-acetyltransferase [Boseongicola sp.]NNJ66691.1 GNAT family N-acetyltransferase [Boseongicola sp.]